MADDVSTPSLAYTEMKADYWDQIEPLRGGTKAMRDKLEVLLPRHKMEETPQWRYRLDRSFLYPAYDNAVCNVVAKPFSRPVSLTVELPEMLAPLLEDVDLNGRNLTTFAREVFDAGVDYGLTHILVDFPATGGGLSKQDEVDLEIRPTCVHYKPPAVIGWQTRKARNGQTVLTEVRILETRTERLGNYTEVNVDYIRVIRETDWALYRANQQNGAWLLEAAGQNTLGFVPLVTFYTNRTGFMTGRPALWGLSDLNVQHWQVASDYGNIIHVVMTPIIKITGAAEEQVKSLAIGPNRLLTMPEGGDAAYLEHSGAAVQSGRDELTRIEERMRTLSLEPYLSPSGTPTATGRAIDESKSQASILTWVRMLENALEEMFGLAAQWAKVELPEDFSVDVFSEFNLGTNPQGDADAILKDWQAGLIDHETALREKIRHGQYTEALDVEAVMLAVQQEGPALATLTAPFGAADEEDEDEEEEDEEDKEEEDKEKEGTA